VRVSRRTLAPGSTFSAANEDPTKEFGKDKDLTVRARTGDNWRAFVTCPLPSLPAGCTVTDATLRLDTSTLSGGLTYEAARVAAAWTETGLTWGSQPATTGPTTTASTGGGWVTWTVTAQVADMYAAGNYGLRIKDTVEDTAATSTNKYSSQEGSDPPELVLQWG